MIFGLSSEQARLEYGGFRNWGYLTGVLMLSGSLTIWGSILGSVCVTTQITLNPQP